MTEDQAIELARAAATRTADWPYHEYQPTPEKARDWMPHEWVVRAIMAATVPSHEPLTKVRITELAEECGYDGAVATVRLAFQGFKLDDFARAVEREVLQRPNVRGNADPTAPRNT